MDTLSRTENKILMANARQALDGNWGVAIGGTVMYWLIPIFIAFIPFVGRLIQSIISAGLLLGVVALSLSLSRKQPTKATH